MLVNIINNLTEIELSILEQPEIKLLLMVMTLNKDLPNTPK